MPIEEAKGAQNKDTEYRRFSRNFNIDLQPK